MAERHGVVVGRGLAGLCAVRVLATTYEAVTPIERDAYPKEPQVLAAAPQGRHVHVLLARGRRESPA
jgi:hypothetical protein